MFQQDFEKLKLRAEELLNKNPSEQMKSHEHNINTHDLLIEFEKYQTELVIQHQDLLRSQIEIELSYHKYRELYEFAPAGYFTFNAEGIILDVNQTGANLLGVRKEFLINKGFSRYISPEFQSIFYHHRKLVLEEKIHSCELKLVKRKGAFFHVLLHSKAIVDNVNYEEKISTFITDINTFKHDDMIFQNHQPKFSSYEGLDPLINLNPTIANEITRSLNCIEHHLNDCSKYLNSREYTSVGLENRMKAALNQIDQTTAMVSHIKSFAEKNQFNYQPHCIITLIKEVITTLQCEIGNDTIEFSFTSPLEVPKILIDKIYIQQVVLNLARSAIYWMIDNNVHRPTLNIVIKSINAKTLEINIIDNGPTLTEEMLNNLFIQRYTVRETQGGLNLALCRKIIEAHGGYLLVENNATKGGSFKFTLTTHQI